MSNKVNKTWFWKDRIIQAKNNGKLHYSVFLANDAIWNHLNNDHKTILDKEIKATDKVLDAGCGYGRNSEMVKSKKYIGVDFSPDFIDEAKTLYPEREFIVADIKNLPFKDKEFDIGFCVSVKAMIVGNLGYAEWQPMEDELKRVCKKVLLLEYGSGDSLSEFTSDQYETI